MRSLLYLFVVAVAATPPARKQKRVDKKASTPREARKQKRDDKKRRKYCFADANDSCDLLHNAVGGNCLKRLRKDPALCRRLRNTTRNAVGYLEDTGAPPIEPILRPVVIGAGFGHTGTHAVAAYLDELGFNVLHNLPHVVVDAIRCRNFAKLDAFDAFFDDPLAATWPILRRVFPNHRLVLTHRDDYKRVYAPDDARCVARRERRDPITLAHAASSCMVFGAVCAADRAWNKRLQDENVRRFRDHELVARHRRRFGIEHGRARSFDIKRGELNFTTMRDFIGTFGAAATYTGAGPHHPDWPFDHKVDSVGFSRGSPASKLSSAGTTGGRTPGRAPRTPKARDKLGARAAPSTFLDEATFRRAGPVDVRFDDDIVR